MAEYFALVNDKYIQLDTRNEQMEIYESEAAANVELIKIGSNEIAVRPVSVVNSTDYDSLERERDALRALVMRVAEGKCTCTMSQRLNGDGCEVCNPQMAIEIARENAKGADHDRVERRL